MIRSKMDSGTERNNILDRVHIAAVFIKSLGTVNFDARFHFLPHLLLECVTFKPHFPLLKKLCKEMEKLINLQLTRIDLFNNVPMIAAIQQRKQLDK